MINGNSLRYPDDEISLKLGVSKQRIQQIEKRALGKLKHTKSLLEYSRNMQD